MTDRTRRRLERLERALGATQRGFDTPHPLETVSGEDREALRPYLEARKHGAAGARAWPAGVHRAMHRYLRACAERERAMREAGVPLSIAETLRRCRFRNGRDAGQHP